MNNNVRQRILIIKLGALGDFVMQMDYVAAIHKAYPNAHFTFMTSKPFVPFVKCLSWVEDIIVDSHPRLNLMEWVRICKKQIADRHFDFIFDLQNSKRTRERYFSLVRFFSAQSVTWMGFQKKAPMCVRRIDKKHAWSLGKVTFDKMEIPLEPVDLSVFKGEEKNFHLLPDVPFALVIPGCSPKHPYKRYPKELYTEVVQMLEAKGVPAVVLGTRVEAEQISYICAHTHAINFQDKASLLDMPALAKRALCVIGNDTGPVHMACLCGTKGVVLFCEKTSKSAQNLANIKNIIATNIGDIPPTEILKQLSDLIKD